MVFYKSRNGDNLFAAYVASPHLMCLVSPAPGKLVNIIAIQYATTSLSPTKSEYQS